MPTVKLKNPDGTITMGWSWPKPKHTLSRGEQPYAGLIIPNVNVYLWASGKQYKGPVVLLYQEGKIPKNDRERRRYNHGFMAAPLLPDNTLGAQMALSVAWADIESAQPWQPGKRAYPYE